MASTTVVMNGEAMTARVGVVGEQAMKEAVQMMASEGVHAYTYTRKDGTLVRVPADVGIRRAVYTAGRTRLNDQTMNVALETRHDLIEVNETRNCRQSHELINGKVFSLKNIPYGCIVNRLVAGKNL